MIPQIKEALEKQFKRANFLFWVCLVFMVVNIGTFCITQSWFNGGVAVFCVFGAFINNYIAKSCLRQLGREKEI